MPLHILSTLVLYFAFSTSLLAAPALLVQVSDGRGNIQTNSFTDDENGSWPPSINTPVVLEVGDSVTFSASGNDPEGETLEYYFALQTSAGSVETVRDWSTNSQWTWNVDSSHFGPNVVVLVAVRDDDGLNFQGSLGDDYTYLIYDVSDPNASAQASFIRITDSLGNIQTNSISSNGQLQWPDAVATPVRVAVGESLTFTANANPGDGGTPQFRFAVQAPGGSFEVFRDWSTSNTATLQIDSRYFGPNVTVLIAVRNGDAVNAYGSFAGDDYTYAIYDVVDPSAGQTPVIKRVFDDRGRSTTNSIGNNNEVGWPASIQSPVRIFIGQPLKVTVVAEDPDSQILEYKFAIQRVGGSLETRQDWSNENTFTLKPTVEDYGARLTLLVSVRDEDGLTQFGDSVGDDYTYLEYQVIVDISSIISTLL